MKYFSRTGTARGFVLVMTLWVLAAVTLAAAFFSLWVQRGVETARATQEERQVDIDLAGTQAVLLYLLSTQGFNYAGLTPPLLKDAVGKDIPQRIVDEDGQVFYPVSGYELRFDDTVYLGRGGTHFSLQVENGLLEINYPLPLHLERLLGLLGIESDERSALIDKLQDYRDVDDLHRINGAESYHYKKLALSPPTNRNLRTPLELRRVLGWRGHPKLLADLEHFSTTGGSGLINVNTAPLPVLQSISGMNLILAKRVALQRPFADIADLQRKLDIGEILAGEETEFYSSKNFRLTLWHPSRPGMRRIYFRLTANSDKRGPWRFRYSLKMPRRSQYDKAKAVMYEYLPADWLL